MRRAQPFRRRIMAGLLTAALATLATVASPAAFAADPVFPTKPIMLVVPFAAGGSLDVTARIIADKLKETLGQQVLITNRPGGGTSVGARSVATAPADGYTLLITSGSAYGYLHLLVPGYEFKLDDFTPIAAVAVNSSIFAVSNGLPVKSMSELVDYVRNKPGGVSFCTTGVGGLNQLQLEMFKGLVKSRTGSDFNVTHVPYNGLAPALIALRTQEVEVCTLPYASLVSTLNGKELRVLSVQRPKRLAGLPDVPTTGEQGFPEMDTNDAFVNIAAPKGTPQPVVARLEAAVLQTMRDPAIRKRIQELDIEPLDMNSRDTGKWLQDDVKKLSAVIEKSGIAAQMK